MRKGAKGVVEVSHLLDLSRPLWQLNSSFPNNAMAMFLNGRPVQLARGDATLSSQVGRPAISKSKVFTI